MKIKKYCDIHYIYNFININTLINITKKLKLCVSVNVTYFFGLNGYLNALTLHPATEIVYV